MLKKQGNSRSELLDKAPPSNCEMEKQLLGGLWVTERDVDRDRLLKWLDEKDFFDPFHQFMFRELKAISSLEIPMVATAIIQSMLERGTLKRARNRFHDNIQHDIGSMLADGIDCRAHFKYYAETIRRFRIQRAHIQIATDVLKLSWDEEQTPESVRKRFYGWMKAVREKVPEYLNGSK
jgi:replicative DNA helicase